jgi:hypothetical protein
MAAVAGMTEDQFMARAYNVFVRAKLEWKPEATTSRTGAANART